MRQRDVPNEAHGKYTTYNNYKCRCSKCKEAYRQHTNASRKDGSRRRVHDSKRRILNAIKTTAGCTDCGYNDNAEALDFDHLYDKQFAVSQSMTRGLSVIITEIMKCEVRCANCHRIKTAERRDLRQDNAQS